MHRFCKSPVIFIDDEPRARSLGAQTLEIAGYNVLAYERAEPALRHVERNWPGVMVMDMMPPEMDGLNFMKKAHTIDPELPVLLTAKQCDVPLAVRAIRDGAFNIMQKPCKGENLISAVDPAVEHRQRILDHRTQHNDPQRRILGQSQAIEKLQKALSILASVDADVLIQGETGTGKERVSRFLHEQSWRAPHPFFAINSGALPDTIIENELFGHEPGAFTGAGKVQIGKLEHANKGTLFLDEIESMPLSCQVKLLRVLEERTIERLGSNKSISLDVRIIAATKISLQNLIREERFRDDLYFRLNVVTVAIPPLRERKEDIPLLFDHFLRKACERFQCSMPTPSKAYLCRLQSHEWPGNVRELQNEAERYVLTCVGLDFRSSTGHCDKVSVNGTLAEQLAWYEKLLIAQELAKQHGNITATQTVLGIARKTLYDKMRRYGLKRLKYISAPAPDCAVVRR